MRWLIGFLCLAAPALAQDLDEARVQISYKELRTLLEAASAQWTPPPLECAVLAARYAVQVEGGAITGTAAFDVQTFRDGPHVVPLVGDGLILENVEPKEAVLLAREGFYALALEGKHRASVTLRFGLPLRKDRKGAEWKVNPAVTTTLEASAQSGPLQVEGAVFAGQGKWRLGRDPLVRLALYVPPETQPPSVTLPAVIREATSEMRVVSDGAFFNKMSWRIQHEGPLVWRLALPESNQLVSAKVGGRAASPSRADAKTLEFRLPESSGEETVVELSYTGRVAPFDPVRGDLALNLPATPLLIESLAWQLTLPTAYDTVAAQGNVEFAPAGSSGEVLLRKELCQGESPSVRLFYQKPEATKKP